MRRLLTLFVLSLLAQPIVAQEPAAPAPASHRTVEFSGLVLINGFFTNARVNNSDVPQFAEADTTGVAGTGATIRQTRLGVFVTDPEVLGGSFTGELDVDFFGGQEPSSGDRTFPLLRVRRARLVPRPVRPELGDLPRHPAILASPTSVSRCT